MLCSCVEKAGPLGILSRHLEVIAGRDAINDLGPGLSEIVRAIQIWVAIIQLITLRGEVGGSGVVRSGRNHADSREFRKTENAFRQAGIARDFSPVVTTIGRFVKTTAGAAIVKHPGGSVDVP